MTATSALLTVLGLLFLARGGRPAGGRALAGSGVGDRSECEGVRPCRQRTFEQVQCQVAMLNASARRLFQNYLERQGPPFTENPAAFCSSSSSVSPPFSVRRSDPKPETLASLFRLFAFFDAAFANLTQEQERLDGGGGGGGAENVALWASLGAAAKTTRGVLANLACLLCASDSGLPHVDGVYGASASEDIFERKKRGCQLIGRFVEVVAEAAAAVGRCSRKKRT